MSNSDSSSASTLSGGAGPESAVQAGRSGFVRRLYRTHYDRLVGYLHRMHGGGPPDPEDVAQEAFSRLARMEGTEHLENPKAYLYKIAINISLNEKSRIKWINAFIAEQTGRPEHHREELGPDRIFEDREALRQIGAGIDRLTAKQREILIRTRLRGETYAEIARSRGWSQADISRQLKAALKQLMQEAAGGSARGKKR